MTPAADRGRLQVRAGGATQRGIGKSQNQDAFCRLGEDGVPDDGRGQIFAVADGVSTVRMGQWAARLTCLRIEQSFHDEQPISTSSITQLIGEIDWELRGEGRGTAACTLSLLWLHDREAVIVHVGDSAIYRMRGGIVSLMTTPHGKSRSLRAFMGMGPTVSEVCNVIETPLRSGDVFFLVTDGVSNLIPPAVLVMAWAKSKGDPDQCALSILEQITALQGDDDATVVVAQFLSDGSQERVNDPRNAPDIPRRLIE